VAVRERDGHVQSGGDPVHGCFRERVGESVDQGVTSPSVVGAHAAHVAVELASGEEVGQRPLLDAVRPSVGVELLVAHGVEQGGRDDEPAEA
jgi:hypothetical protein